MCSKKSPGVVSSGSESSRIRLYLSSSPWRGHVDMSQHTVVVYMRSATTASHLQSAPAQKQLLEPSPPSMVIKRGQPEGPRTRPCRETMASNGTRSKRANERESEQAGTRVSEKGKNKDSVRKRRSRERGNREREKERDQKRPRTRHQGRRALISEKKERQAGRRKERGKKGVWRRTRQRGNGKQ